MAAARSRHEAIEVRASRYPVGIALFDWLTHDWPNLPWQLGGFMGLLLFGILWSRWRATRGASVSGASTEQ